MQVIKNKQVIKNQNGQHKVMVANGFPSSGYAIINYLKVDKLLWRYER